MLDFQGGYVMFTKDPPAIFGYCFFFQEKKIHHPDRLFFQTPPNKKKTHGHSESRLGRWRHGVHFYGDQVCGSPLPSLQRGWTDGGLEIISWGLMG